MNEEACPNCAELEARLHATEVERDAALYQLRAISEQTGNIVIEEKP